VIYNIQLLRAFAALSVVYLHVVSDAGLNLDIGVGNFGVDLFFVISGFTMAYVGHMPAGTFFVRRCIRIIPLYWLATLGTFLIAWFAPTLIQSASASVPHLLHSLVFLPFPNKFGLLQPTLALGWTLNYEMYFYLLFTAALVFTLRHAPLLACVFIVAICMVIRFAGLEDRSVLFYADPIVYEFAMGILVYYSVASMSLRIVAISGGIRAVLAIVALAAAIALPLQENIISGERALWAGIPAAILVFSSVLLEKRGRMAARHSWVVLLGDSSYVLYLVHPYIVYGIIRLFLTPAKMSVPALALAIVGLPLIAMVAAIGIHLGVERPVTALLRNRLSPKQASAVALPEPTINVISAKE
jgi:exopolysaccharide production protein ExoZ